MLLVKKSLEFTKAKAICVGLISNFFAHECVFKPYNFQGKTLSIVDFENSSNTCQESIIGMQDKLLFSSSELKTLKSKFKKDFSNLNKDMYMYFVNRRDFMRKTYQNSSLNFVNYEDINFTFLKCNVESENSVNDLFQFILKKYKRIDYFFSNAISRASKTMSECRQIKHSSKKTGTDNL